MAYCRFSTDDYRSDVSVFDGDSGGVETHVASTRYRFTAPLPAPVEVPDNPTSAQVMARVLRDSQVMRILAAAGSAPIGLPHDGEKFFDFTPDEAISRLLALRELGYHVPQSGLDALREAAEV